jgi:hypothetical protein
VVYGARFADAEIGGLDLNVKPKKTEVYVDGEFVGLAKDFDGYPGYLWLDKGCHEITLYRPGYQTWTQRFTVRTGLVIDVRVRMVEGEAVPPSPPAAAAPVAGSDRDRATAERPPVSGKPEPPRVAEVPVGSERDVRADPGRLELAVSPDDASIYLDGRFLGSGRELADLHAGLVVDPGSHRLEVVRPGFEARQVDFVVASGGSVSLEVDLRSE